jgi:hypothetical protein
MPEPTNPKPAAPPQTRVPAASGQPKKKSLFEWIMLAIGLSYGDEGEDKWAKQRAAAAQEQSNTSPNDPRR